MNGKRPLFIALTALGALLMLVNAAFSSEPGWIMPEKVGAMLKEGSALWLVDVRDSVKFNNGHIEGAVNITTEEIAVKRLPVNKTFVIVDDTLGLRMAKEAVSKLNAKGIKRIFIMEGGIAAWEREGYPITGFNASSRGVTAAELKWAADNGAALRIYDLRSEKDFKKNTVKGAVWIKGRDLPERVVKFKETVQKPEHKTLAKRLDKASSVILVFSAPDNAAQITDAVARKGLDVRYLIGGYEAWAAMDAKPGKKTVGECPSCPNPGKGGKQR
ncbi:MAG: hypothetical protein HZB85_00840 [Deltaproteobacteria bacterium]|nr:hypothetical protein [Deltaproteobacteria bacterium]